MGLDEGVLRRENTGPNGATSLQDSMLDSVTVTLFGPKMNLVVNSAIHSPAIISDSYDTATLMDPLTGLLHLEVDITQLRVQGKRHA